jgi:transposase
VLKIAVPRLAAHFPLARSSSGAKKAILAVAASMLTATYFMLRDGVEYQDLGASHFDHRDKTSTIRRLVRRLSDLGCQVEIRNHAA